MRISELIVSDQEMRASSQKQDGSTEDQKPCEELGTQKTKVDIMILVVTELFGFP